MKSIYHILIVLLIFFSCKKDDKLYSGGTKISFDNAMYEYTLSFTDDSIIDIKIPVVLIGNSFSENIDFSVSIAHQTDSIEDGQISVPTMSTFNSGVYNDSLIINVDPATIPENSDYYLTLEIGAENKSIVAENYDTCQLHIHKGGFIDIFIGRYSCFESGISDSYQTSFIKQSSSDSSVLNTNFWNFNAEEQYVQFIFERSSNIVDIPQQQWTDSAQTSYTVWGNGTYLMDGSMVLNYFMQKLDEDEIYESGVHKYTKID